MKKSSTKTTVQCALFLAIAVMLGYFSQMIPIGGSGSLRIGISGFFYKMPSLLFGPVYGGVIYGLKDFLSYLVKPEGAYIFPLTVVAVAGGFINGLIFKLVKERSGDVLRKVYLLVIGLIGAAGVFNHLNVLYHPNGIVGQFIIGLKKNTFFLTYGMYITFVIGMAFYFANLYITKKNNRQFSDNHFRIFVSLFVSDLFITTVNTFILRIYFSGLGKLPFMAVYLPRLAEELILIFISSYVITHLYNLYQRIAIGVLSELRF